MKKLLFLLPLFLTSCLFNNDDEMAPPEPIDPIDQLPPITMEGANTFGCLMNGEAWIPDVISFFDDDLDVIYDEPNFHLQIQANLINDTNDQYLVFSALNVDGLGERNIFYHDEIFIDFNEGHSYEIDTLQVRKITINRLDLNNQIISGMFQFTLINKNLNDTLQITEGRFDVKYRK